MIQKKNYLIKSYGIFVSAFLMLILTSCWNDSEKVETNVLRVGTYSEPLDLDPQVVTSTPDQKILRALFEGLVTPHPKTLLPEPAVAQSWTVSTDGLVYTFYLRENAHWSNGDLITADDFVYSYQRLLSPQLGSENASLFYVLVGAKAYNEGTLTDFADVGVNAIDQHTLELRLIAPTPYLLSLLTHHAFYPVHAATLRKHGAQVQRGTAWTQEGNHVSNGAFRLVTWRHNDFIYVEKNPYYWDAAKVQLTGIRFIPIADANTEELSFRAGQIDITDSVPTGKIDDYITQKSPFLRMHPFLATYYYVLNTNHPPLDDVRVRQALSLVINREELASKVIKRGQHPAYQFTSPDIQGYKNGKTLISYNVAQAQRLLAQAGYPNGEGFPEIELLFNHSAVNKPIAEAIQQMWKKELNITISLNSIEWKVYLTHRREGNFDIARMSWVGNYIDPNTFLEIFTSNSTNNYSGWKNSRYDALMTQASQTNDRVKRYTYLRQAEQLLLTELPLIPIYFHNSAALVRPEVTGYTPNLLDRHPYKYIGLEQAGSSLDRKN